MAVALEVEDGTGVEDANTYASLDHAAGFYTDRDAFATPTPHPWFAMSTARRAVQLVRATNWIEARYTWGGVPLRAVQGLALPRLRLVTRAGLIMTAAGQVTRAADAVSYLALKLADAEALEAEENITQERLMDHWIYYGSQGRRVNYGEVDRILAGMYLTGGISGGTMRMVRG